MNIMPVRFLPCVNEASEKMVTLLEQGCGPVNGRRGLMLLRVRGAIFRIRLRAKT